MKLKSYLSFFNKQSFISFKSTFLIRKFLLINDFTEKSPFLKNNKIIFIYKALIFKDLERFKSSNFSKLILFAG